jgi:hydrogenase maturation protease
MRRPLIIGFGNPLRGDDGLGCRSAELIQFPDADVLTCRQLTPELAGNVSAASMVIFLDASLDQEPGTVVSHEVGAEPGGAWTHQLSPGQILGLAREVFGRKPSAFLITGGVERVGWGEGLTASVELCAGEMARVARRLLEQRCVPIQ